MSEHGKISNENGFTKWTCPVCNEDAYVDYYSVHEFVEIDSTTGELKISFRVDCENCCQQEQWNFKNTTVEILEKGEQPTEDEDE